MVAVTISTVTSLFALEMRNLVRDEALPKATQEIKWMLSKQNSPQEGSSLILLTGHDVSNMQGSASLVIQMSAMKLYSLS